MSTVTMDLKFYELSDFPARLYRVKVMLKDKRNNEYLCCYKSNCTKHLNLNKKCERCARLINGSDNNAYCCFCCEIFRLENALTSIPNLNIPDQIKIDTNITTTNILLCTSGCTDLLNMRCLYIQIARIIDILRMYRDQDKKCCYKVVCCKHIFDVKTQRRCRRCYKHYIEQKYKYCCFCDEMYKWEELQRQIDIIKIN
jgi:hypothetical protein